MKYSFSASPRQRRGNSRGIKALGPKGAKGALLDPQLFINKAKTAETATEYTPSHVFSDFALDDSIKAILVERGYTTPTAIQDQALPIVLEGKDVIGLANTGTGKTATFLLPIINAHLQQRQGPALIMAPTRELAMQIRQECLAFTKGMRIRSCLCVGGQSMKSQIMQLKKHPNIIIGTPGRLKDLYQQEQLPLSEVTCVVLDEVDRMLDMGFITDIKTLIAAMPSQKQSLFFSATMTKDIERLAMSFLQEPVTVSVRVAETSDHVEQDVVYVPSQDAKLEVLSQMLTKPEFAKVIVFGGTKWGVQKLSLRLEQQGLKAVAIHGDKTQGQRFRALNDFKSEKATILVATDVAARGLDIPLVSHVINYDLPQTYEDYTHRIGRTGRAGNSGVALTFIVGREQTGQGSAEAAETEVGTELRPSYSPRSGSGSRSSASRSTAWQPTDYSQPRPRRSGGRGAYQGGRPASRSQEPKPSAKKSLAQDGSFSSVRRGR